MRGNLPVEVSSFVGRRQEIATAGQLLERSRLLTLTGPGGIGKTRLARRVAAARARAFRDGVWFVELEAVPVGGPIAPAVLSALRAPDDGPHPGTALTQAVAGKNLLLVLDGCEHVTAQVTQVVHELRRVAPRLTVLATSRHVLDAEGEQVLTVGPLADAVSLFTERAAAAGFTPTAADEDAVTGVCAKLDGMPLAVELAAVRLRSIPLAELNTHLDDVLPLLTAGPRTAPARQRTLDATIEWSHRLCSPAEQRTWQVLSVFTGPFGVDAAVAVAGGSRIEVLDVLTGLVDKSILVGPTPRYTMLETIRQFGRGRLADPAAGIRHRNHYAALAARGQADYLSPRDVEWFHDVRAELPDVRAAITDGLGTPDALEMVADLRPYWAHTGLTREGMEWVERALAADRMPSRPRARALCAGVQLAALLGLDDRAMHLIDECRALLDGMSEPSIEAELVEHSALVAYLAGDMTAALERAQAAATKHLGLGEPARASDALLVASSAAFELGDHRATGLSEQNLQLARTAGAHLALATASWVAGLAAWRAGRSEESTALLHEALREFTPFDQSVLIAMSIEALACVATAAGAHERAATLFGAAEPIWHTSAMLPRRISNRISRSAASASRTALGDTAFDAAFRAGAMLDRAETLAFALDERAARPRTPPTETAGMLTRREVQVARLIADGLSNRDISAKLVISLRTAEAHAEHIRTKLGFTSRSQIAAWIASGDHAN